MIRRLGRLVAVFTESLEVARYSPRTLEGYRVNLARLIELLAHQDIEDAADVTPDALQACQSALLTRTGRAGRPLAVATLADFASDVRTFFRYLAKKGYVLVNPAQELEVPRRLRQLPDRVLDLASLKRLLLAPDVRTGHGLRDRAVIELLYSTGIRVTELVQMRIHDINLAEGELLVREGKGRKSRLIPVGAAACRWVQRYLSEVRPHFATRTRTADATLFLSVRGRRLHRVVMARLLREYGQAAGITASVSPHVLRHTFATHMLRGKASLRHLQEMLGHKRLTTTQIYTKVDISDLKAVHRRCHPRGKE